MAITTISTAYQPAAIVRGGQKRGQTHFSLNGQRWKQSCYAREECVCPLFCQTTISATGCYALDEATVRTLERMAARWGVSKSEALRRAISSAAGEMRPGPVDAVAALDELQKSLGLTPRQTDSWVRSVRAERRAWRRRGHSAK